MPTRVSGNGNSLITVNPFMERLLIYYWWAPGFKAAHVDTEYKGEREKAVRLYVIYYCRHVMRRPLVYIFYMSKGSGLYVFYIGG